MSFSVTAKVLELCQIVDVTNDELVTALSALKSTTPFRSSNKELQGKAAAVAAILRRNFCTLSNEEKEAVNEDFARKISLITADDFDLRSWQRDLACYWELACEKLSRLPIEDEDDLTDCIEALQSIVLSSADSTNSVIAAKMAPLVADIREFLADPSLYVQDEKQYGDFKAIVLDVIADKVSQLGNSRFNLAAYVKKKKERDEIAKNSQEAMLRVSKPDLNSESHVFFSLPLEIKSMVQQGVDKGLFDDRAIEHQIIPLYENGCFKKLSMRSAVLNGIYSLDFLFEYMTFSDGSYNWWDTLVDPIFFLLVRRGVALKAKEAVALSSTELDLLPYFVDDICNGNRTLSQINEWSWIKKNVLLFLYEKRARQDITPERLTALDEQLFSSQTIQLYIEECGWSEDVLMNLPQKEKELLLSNDFAVLKHYFHLNAVDALEKLKDYSCEEWQQLMQIKEIPFIVYATEKWVMPTELLLRVPRERLKRLEKRLRNPLIACHLMEKPNDFLEIAQMTNRAFNDYLKKLLRDGQEPLKSMYRHNKKILRLCLKYSSLLDMLKNGKITWSELEMCSLSYEEFNKRLKLIEDSYTFFEEWLQQNFFNGSALFLLPCDVVELLSTEIIALLVSEEKIKPLAFSAWSYSARKQLLEMVRVKKVSRKAVKAMIDLSNKGLLDLDLYNLKNVPFREAAKALYSGLKELPLDRRMAIEKLNCFNAIVQNNKVEEFFLITQHEVFDSLLADKIMNDSTVLELLNLTTEASYYVLSLLQRSTGLKVLLKNELTTVQELAEMDFSDLSFISSHYKKILSKKINARNFIDTAAAPPTKRQRIA